jgi:hypothetical protein
MHSNHLKPDLVTPNKKPKDYLRPLGFIIFIIQTLELWDYGSRPPSVIVQP